MQNVSDYQGTSIKTHATAPGSTATSALIIDVLNRLKVGSEHLNLMHNQMDTASLYSHPKGIIHVDMHQTTMKSFTCY